MDVFERAVSFALKVHAGVSRKGERIPFILHPLEVATIVATLSADLDLMAAAVLHDTVEDTETTLGDLDREFGPRVAALVGSETEDKRREIPASQSWRIRKEESLALLRETDDLDVKRLWLADKLSNMRSFYRQHARHGTAFWSAFNQKDPEAQYWYYASSLDLTAELADTAAWQEFRQLMSIVFERG